MTELVGTQDWIKPLPGGSRTIVNTFVNMQAAGGSYASPVVGVSGFSGLYIELRQPGTAADFYAVQVVFQDAAGSQPIAPTWNAIVRGDQILRANVPVLGGTAKVQVIGPQRNQNSPLVVVGHGGGGSPGYRTESTVLIAQSPASVGAGGFSTAFAGVVMEGPATAVIDAATLKWTLWVRAYDQTGFGRLIASANSVTNTDGTISLWIPPCPVDVAIFNNDTVAHGFSYSLVLGRT